jgi:hypothetical protein
LTTYKLVGKLLHVCAYQKMGMKRTSAFNPSTVALSSAIWRSERFIASPFPVARSFDKSELIAGIFCGCEVGFGRDDGPVWVAGFGDAEVGFEEGLVFGAEG